jgi:Leucine-rich repeat (LRR) protein
MGNVQVTSTQGAMLLLNPFFNGDIVGQDFPEEITEITELNQILANHMKFTSLPESIGNLQNLKKLTLKGNQLEEVPESIGQLTELRTLDLSNNNLTSLPEEIGNCRNLKSVVLKGNNIPGDELSRIQAMLPDKCKVK